MSTENQKKVEPIYYFGCGIGHKGHYLWGPNMRSAKRDEPGGGMPWGQGFNPNGLTHLDTGLCSKERGEKHRNGCWKLTHKGGWTAWAFWDCSGDSRPNSHSTFIAPGKITADGMKALAQEHFPKVMKRASVYKLYPCKDV